MLEEKFNILPLDHHINTSNLVKKQINEGKKLISNTNCGRWREVEHKKFLEAIIMHGNDWKSINKFIKSRSSTQARSHAQKFLLKLRKKLNIIPTYDRINHTIKLSNESIQKIIREIIQTSSFKESNINKEKLVRLILGFSNLLIGKSKLLSINSSSSFSEKNMSMNYTIKNGMLLREEYLNGKVFLIEKIRKKESVNYSISDNQPFYIDKSKKLEEFLNSANSKKNDLQFSNKNELIDILLQQKKINVDPLNPNKNIINIISINIRNKNNEIISNDKQILSIPNLNVDTNFNSQNGQICNFKENDQIEFSNKQSHHSNTLSWLNSSTVDSPENIRTNIFDKDIYGDSTNYFGFNPNGYEDEVDGFFNL